MKATKSLAAVVLLGILILPSCLTAQTIDTLWTRMIPGPEGHDSSICVVETADSGLAICGMTMGPGAVYSDIWLVRTDAYGDTLWTRTIGDSLGQSANEMVETHDGSFVMAGYHGRWGVEYYPFVVKTDASGDTLWTRTVGAANGMFYGVTETADSSILAVGYRYESGLSRNLILAKLDSDGNTVWGRSYGGAESNEGWSVMELADGTLALAGSYYDNYQPFLRDYWLVKTDNAGTELWNQRYGGNSVDPCYSAAATSDGGFVLAGYSSSVSPNGAWIVKTDSLGDTLWTQTLESMDIRSVLECNEGGYFCAGWLTNYGFGRDFLGVMLSEAGDTLWTASFGTLRHEQAHCTVQTYDGDFVMTGVRDGESSYQEFYLMKIGDAAMDVGDIAEGNLPDGFALAANYPNPFNPSTTINYTVPRRSEVRITVVNVTGQLVKTLKDATVPAGTHEVVWDGTDRSGNAVASGMYLYRLQTGEYSQVRKMMLLK